MDGQMEKQANFTINKTIEVLIQQIEPLTKQNQASVNMSPLLDEFYQTVLQSETYLRNGVFTINFAKAAIFLDHAFYIYSKQVDLLWNMAINSQRRYLSYEDDCKEKEEEQRKLEEKAQKGKRGRKKKVTEETKEEVNLKKAGLKSKKHCRIALENTAEFNFETEVNITDVNPAIMERFQNIIPVKNEDAKYPKRYDMFPYVEDYLTVDIDEDCRYNEGSVAMNYLDFQFPEIQRLLTYNCTNNKKLDIVGCDVSDNALQHYIIELELNPCDFTTETNQNFKKYLDKYLVNGPQKKLAEQRKKLCPRRPSIMLTRLPDDVVQQHMKQDDRVTPGPSRNDSGYFEDMDETEFPEFSEEDTILPKEPCTPSLVTQELSSTKDIEAPKDTSTPKETSMPIETSVTTMVEITPNLRKIIDQKATKRKIAGDETNEATPKKRIRKKAIFKWLKTTTASLKAFESFFCKHYLTEDGEGEIEVEPDLSTDEEDNEASDLTDVGQSLPNSTFLDTMVSNETEHTQDAPTEDRLEETLSNNQSENLPPDFELTENDEILRRYVQWKNYMREELSKYGQEDFDIHQYGTRIINKLSDDKPTKFAEVLQTDSRNDVARCFAAALQLINSGNIQLTNWTPGEVATDLEMVLLNRDRPHEHLDSYQAPSKQMIQNRIQELQNVEPCSSTVENESRQDSHSNVKKYKRRKLSK